MQRLEPAACRCQGCVYQDTESTAPSSICNVCSRHDDANREDCHIAIDEWLNTYRLIGKRVTDEVMQCRAVHVLRIRFAARDDTRHVYYVNVDGQQRVEDVKRAYRAAGLDCD